MQNALAYKQFDKNYIINGGLHHWRRGTTFTTTQADQTQRYNVERFLTAISTGGTARSLTNSQSTNLPTGFYAGKYSMKITNNTSVSSLAAAETVQGLSQLMEGRMVYGLLPGDFTFGCWIWSYANNVVVPINFRNGSSTRTFTTTRTLKSGWNYVIAHVPSDSSESFAYLTGNEFGVRLLSVSGTNFHAPELDTWLSGNYSSHSSCTNWLSSTGDKFYIAGIQVRPGFLTSNVMMNDFRLYTENLNDEFNLCCRYYNAGYIELQFAPVTSGNGYVAVAFLHEFLRTSAVTTLVNDGNTSFPATVGTGSAGGNRVVESRTANATANGRFSSFFTVDAEF